MDVVDRAKGQRIMISLNDQESRSEGDPSWELMDLDRLTHRDQGPKVANSRGNQYPQHDGWMTLQVEC